METPTRPISVRGGRSRGCSSSARGRRYRGSARRRPAARSMSSGASSRAMPEGSDMASSGTSPYGIGSASTGPDHPALRRGAALRHDHRARWRSSRSSRCSTWAPTPGTWPDKWTVVTATSVARQFEHTILITEHGNEILTLPDPAAPPRHRLCPGGSLEEGGPRREGARGDLGGILPGSVPEHGAEGWRISDEPRRALTRRPAILPHEHLSVTVGAGRCDGGDPQLPR